MKRSPQKKSLANIVWFSIIASILTIVIKYYAYKITDSVGFLSDAMESLINLGAAIVAYIMLTIASRPPDKEHPFGHDKAEYFSSLIEGVLIIIASVGIIYTAINRIYHPKALEELNLGILLSIIATFINFLTARILLFYGKKHNSITLEADSHHLMTDVWTTVGIIAGILLVKFTDWNILDPIMAVVVAGSILYTGARLIVRSVDGLMDKEIAEKDLLKIKHILDKFYDRDIHYHALYTRQSSSKKFISFHLLFPGDFTLYMAHELTKEIEGEIIKIFPYSDIFIHMEPINDPDAFDDFLNSVSI